MQKWLTSCPVTRSRLPSVPYRICLEMTSRSNSSLQQLCSNFIWSPTLEQNKKLIQFKHRSNQDNHLTAFCQLQLKQLTPCVYMSQHQTTVKYWQNGISRLFGSGKLIFSCIWQLSPRFWSVLNFLTNNWQSPPRQKVHLIKYSSTVYISQCILRLM